MQQLFANKSETSTEISPLVQREDNLVTHEQMNTMWHHEPCPATGGSISHVHSSQ